MKSFLSIFFFVVFTFSAHASCKNPIVSVVSDETGLKTYTPNEKAPIGQILILPPTGGENFTDRRVARKLCRTGLLVHVLNYSQFSGLTLDLTIHQRTSDLVLRSVNDFMLQNPNPTVVVGASLGGIYASMVYSLGMNQSPQYPGFAHVKGLVTIVAGGPMVDILMTSQIEEAVKQRRLRMRSGAYESLADYREQLDAAITTDPFRLARPSDNVLSYISLNDKKVPTKTQFKLARAHKAKIRTIRLLGHPTSVLYSYYTQGGEIAYFAKRILEKN